MNMEHTQVVNLESVLNDLKSTDIQVLRNAAFASADEHYSEAVNLLCGLLLNPSVGVQEAAEHALRKIRGQKTIHGLIPFLFGSDATARNIAMDILREIASDDLDYLKRYVQDEDVNIRIYITDILGYSGDRMVVSTLAEALIKDVDVNVRHHAAVSLGILAFPECIDPLAQAMQDEEWVQFAAVESLTRIHDESTIDTLVNSLSTCSDVIASTIIHALGEIGNIKTIPLLFKSMEKASTTLRRKVVRSIIQILGEKSLALLSQKDQSKLKTYLLDALGDSDESIQLAALSGLVVMGDEKITNKLLQFTINFKVDDNHENIMRKAAIRCLAKIGFNNCFLEHLNTNDDKLLSLLIEISSVMNNRRFTEEIKKIFWHKNTVIQRLIALHLSKICEKEDLQFFMDILTSHEDDHIIKNTIVFLGSYTECAKCADLIFEKLNHSYDDIKEAALIACINIATPNIKIRFKELYNNADPDKRIIAIYALFNFDTENIADEVKKAIRDIDPKIRQLAIRCIGSNAKSLNENIAEIIECLNDTDNNVRITAIELIGKSNDEQVVMHLINALEDNSEWVAIRAIEALGELQETSAVPVMIQMLENSTPMVTFSIINCLGKIGGKVAFNSLLNMMDQDNKEIRNSIESAIVAIRSNGENS